MEEKNMKKATIRDVAKAAGVSQSTVSRVLNNNGYVGEDARRRVEEAMEALHYSPSAIAVCLSKSRSRMIGVIVPQIFAPFFSRMYYIADRVMERYGYRLLLCNSDENLKREKELIDDLLSYKIAALFIVPVDRDEGTNKAYLNHIRNTGMPVVCVDREIEGIQCDGVYIDNYTACYEITKDVLARGYRNIAYMADPPIYGPGRDRLRGFRDACKEFGVTVPEENIFLAPIEDTEPLNAFLHDIARRDDPPKAIINFVRGWDYIMLQALHSAGLRVPEDVYLTGFDDDNTLPNFGYSMQYLPSVIDFSEAAAKLLIERVQAQKTLFGNMSPAERDTTDETDTRAALFDMMTEMEPYDEMWPDYVQLLEDNGLQANLDDMDGGYENLLVYFLYRHFAHGVTDGRIAARVGFCAVSVWFICLMNTKCLRDTGEFTPWDRIVCTKDYSKQVEYSAENMEMALDALHKDPIFSAEHLKRLFG